MRILVAMLSVGFAGTERHTVELTNELSRQGHDVALLLRGPPREADRQAAYGMMRRGIAAGIPIFLASRAMPVFALWRALILFRPDIIHAHHERAVRLTSRYAGRVPVLGTIHMHYSERDFGRCDGVICLTETEAAAVPDRFSGLRFVNGNWVRPHHRPSAEVLAARRDELGLGVDDYVVGTVARLEPMKGLADLIRGYHAARLEGSRLVLVGEGRQRAELRDLAASLGLTNQIVFAGFRQDARDLYYLFDLFVLTSVDDPYPLVILEAADAGLPVIAADAAGPVAMSRRLPLEIVPIRSPVAVAAALRKLYRQPAPTYDMSCFSITSRVETILAAYRSVIDAHRRKIRRPWQV